MTDDARAVLAHLQRAHQHNADLLALWRRDPGWFESPDAPEVVRDIGRHPDLMRFVHDTMLSAQPYFMSSDMNTLVQHAYTSMPRQDVLETDLPDRAGFMVIDGQFLDFEDEIVIRRAVYWARVPSGAGVLICTLIEIELDGVTEWQHCGGYTWRFGNVPPFKDDSVGPKILAAWTLMQQKFTENVAVPAPRTDQRRLKRLGVPAPEIRVVQFRKTESHKSSGIAEEIEKRSVEWSHRWITSGHWRNQWLPSVKAHRQQWIAPYVKGPSDKPLVVHKNVKAFVK